MKRRNVLSVAIAIWVASSLAGCGDTRAEKREAAAPATAGWTIPPRIESVLRAQASLIFRGTAEPGGRVVLRSAQGAAFATVANDTGRFEIRMAVPAGHLMLTPETQVGQEASPAPQRLLILDGGRGPIALLTPGAPTRRLDRGPALGAIDAAGSTLLISGQASAEGPVAVSIDGRAMPATTGPSGAWSLVVDQARSVTVSDAVFAYPGGGEGADWAEPVGQGWYVRWTAPDGARQSTWLPIA